MIEKLHLILTDFKKVLAPIDYLIFFVSSLANQQTVEENDHNSDESTSRLHLYSMSR